MSASFSNVSDEELVKRGGGDPALAEEIAREHPQLASGTYIMCKLYIIEKACSLIRQ